MRFGNAFAYLFNHGLLWISSDYSIESWTISAIFLPQTNRATTTTSRVRKEARVESLRKGQPAASILHENVAGKLYADVYYHLYHHFILMFCYYNKNEI